ncbi:MAG: MBL fold metallo-hydrolase [Methanoregula sp.]|jgi:hydroxyacylglutathione hydrolase|nr:MBL fold metallo-hydrolase [Methanoregula sp.]
MGVEGTMLFERIVSEGIAHNSYLIGSGGRAAVIDPRRDCDIYLDIAQRNEMVITHIFETHRNEDYTIGSRELRKRCGAAIYHGEKMAFSYGKPAKEGDTFTLGSLVLSVLETPGHTEESISFVLQDTDVGDQPYMVFSGDTLFAGDIARTDFFGQERKAEMAAKIYDSIIQKILPLGDGVILCPAHGAGSICGGEIADHPFTTIGYEKQTNPLLIEGREHFISHRATESPYVPPYFQQMEKNNTHGAPILLHMPVQIPLSVPEINHLRKTGCQIIDIRSPTSFGAGYIPGSLSIWREGLPSFMGWFLDYQRPIIIIDDFNLDLDRVLRHFIRLGYDSIAGVLSGGFVTWIKAAQEIGTVPTCSVQQLKERLEKEKPFILDVRDSKNWRAVGHIRGAYHVYIGELLQHLDEIPKNESIVVYCDAGYKGSLAASILAIHQFHGVTNVLGGMTAWKRAGFKIEK